MKYDNTLQKCNSKRHQNDEPEPLKLDDPNEHCLAKIFEYLNVKDLVNVAVASSHFIPSAQVAFSRNYWNEKFLLSTIKIQHRDYFAINKNLAMPFFDHFGSYITELLIECADELNQPIETAVLRRCTASLLALDLICMTENRFEAINKSFQNVIELSIVRGKLSKNCLTSMHGSRIWSVLNC